MIAIDVALFLPDDVRDTCIEINSKSAEQDKQYRPLGTQDYIPHITLSLGCVENEDIEKIKEFIDDIASQTKPLLLKLDKISYVKGDDGNSSMIDVAHSTALQELHENVMKKISPYLKEGASVEMIHKGDETGLKDTSKLMLDTYKDRFALSHYYPHITLGCYDAAYDKFPLEFVADTIVLAQVGDGCTCRKVLHSAKLSL